MKSLLPCPFCGGEAMVIDGIGECDLGEGPREKAFVECRNGCGSRTAILPNPNVAMVLWNTRNDQ